MKKNSLAFGIGIIAIFIVLFIVVIGIMYSIAFSNPNVVSYSQGFYETLLTYTNNSAGINITAPARVDIYVCEGINGQCVTNVNMNQQNSCSTASQNVQNTNIGASTCLASGQQIKYFQANNTFSAAVPLTLAPYISIPGAGSYPVGGFHTICQTTNEVTGMGANEQWQFTNMNTNTGLTSRTQVSQYGFTFNQSGPSISGYQCFYAIPTIYQVNAQGIFSQGQQIYLTFIVNSTGYAPIVYQTTFTQNPGGTNFAVYNLARLNTLAPITTTTIPTSTTTIFPGQTSTISVATSTTTIPITTVNIASGTSQPTTSVVSSPTTIQGSQIGSSQTPQQPASCDVGCTLNNILQDLINFFTHL